VEQLVRDRKIFLEKKETGIEKKAQADWTIALDAWIQIVNEHEAESLRKRETAEQAEKARLFKMKCVII
jgi:hypothetical protein